MPDFDRIKRDIRERYPTVAQITVPELRAWLADPQRPAPLLIDVRSVAEYEVSHLVGAAQAETLPEIRRIVESDPGQRPVVFYCSVGERSSRAARDLAAVRSNQSLLFNLEGSIFEWVMAGGNVVAGTTPVDKVHPYDAHWGRLLPARLRWEKK